VFLLSGSLEQIEFLQLFSIKICDLFVSISIVIPEEDTEDSDSDMPREQEEIQHRDEEEDEKYFDTGNIFRNEKVTIFYIKYNFA